MRFLVVDDSLTMRQIERCGLHTDWNMPYMNGIEFIRTVRTLEKSKETPVLMVTTHAATNDIVEALRAGVNSYIVKPFSVETFRDKIDAVCDKHSSSAGTL